jgi:hypothetical protein
MQIAFVLNPRTGRPHVEDHGVSMLEVREILTARPYDEPARGGARAATGRTDAGRLLRVIYRRTGRDSRLVITAYPLAGNAARAYRRKRRRGEQ